MQLELMKEFKFEASHILPKHPGKCSRLHGHSWVLRVYCRGEINPETGFVHDYADIKAVIQPLVDSLDHRHLGQWMFVNNINWAPPLEAWELDFYPSSENLLVWIAQQLKPRLQDWSKIELDETCTSSCILTREEFDAI